jgi:hypothetical protein
MDSMFFLAISIIFVLVLSSLFVLRMLFKDKRSTIKVGALFEHKVSGLKCIVCGHVPSSRGAKSYVHFYQAGRSDITSSDSNDFIKYWRLLREGKDIDLDKILVSRREEIDREAKRQNEAWEYLQRKLCLKENPRKWLK